MTWTGSAVAVPLKVTQAGAGELPIPHSEFCQLGTLTDNLLKLAPYFNSESFSHLPAGTEPDFGKDLSSIIMFLKLWLSISVNKIIYQENTGQTDIMYVSIAPYTEPAKGICVQIFCWGTLSGEICKGMKDLAKDVASGEG